MIVSLHAVRRLKFHKLAPKSRDGHKVRDYIKRTIQNHTVNIYQNRRTGAMVKINPTFIAVMYGDRVVTVYPNTQGQKERVLNGLRKGRLQEFYDLDVQPLLQSQFVSSEETAGGIESVEELDQRGHGFPAESQSDEPGQCPRNH